MWVSHGSTLSVAISVTYDAATRTLLLNPVKELELLHTGPAHTLGGGAPEQLVPLAPSRDPTGVVLPGARGSRLDVQANFSIETMTGDGNSNNQ